MIRSVYHFFKAFFIYKLIDITPDYGFHALRKLFIGTNGYFNDIMSFIISNTTFKIKDLKEPSNYLGISDDEIDRAVGELNETGFYQFEATLNEYTVDEIVHYAQNEKCRYLLVPEEDEEKTKVEFSSEQIRYDPKNVIAPKYTFSMAQAMNHPRLQQIIFDKSLLKIAQGYFEARPILDITAMWWSTAFNSKGAAEAAQMYHFDLDRIKFLKFFFYLTDVGANNGPFCYIKNSHKRLPKPIREDRRLRDSEVSDFFPEKNLVEAIGRKGTILAADTRGLHKGKPVIEGHRLLFQIEFCNSYFGVEYPKIEGVTFEVDSMEKIERYPKVYTRILK